MEVKGTAVVVLPQFIRTKFGENSFNQWLAALSPLAREVYSKPILTNNWFPLKEILVEPTQKICDVFYGGKMEGACECGRFSADYALKGIYRVFLKIGSPEFVINRASLVLPTYYRPSKIIVPSHEKGHALFRIVEFPDMNKVIEHRIIGWMEQALTICGCKNPKVKIVASLTEGKPYTELDVVWSA